MAPPPADPPDRSPLEMVGPGSSESSMEDELLPALELAFAPLHKAAFGVATGVAGALLMMAMTTASLLSEHARVFPLGLLREYFAGYSVSWPGVIIGGAWGFLVTFVIGWFIAFCRNLALAITAFTIRTRAELGQTREFLDHI